MMRLTAEEIENLFFHRKDVFALQQENGAYYPERRWITTEDITKHLNGEITIGAYCLETDNTVKWACVDIDVKKKCPKCNGDNTFINNDNLVCKNCGCNTYDEELVGVKAEAETIFNAFPEFRRMLEFSGKKGYHIWIFFNNPENASYARTLVKARLNSIGARGHEVFPKQIELNETRLYGNLVKIPTAKHKVSGQYSVILKVGGWS